MSKRNRDLLCWIVGSGSRKNRRGHGAEGGVGYNTRLGTLPREGSGGRSGSMWQNDGGEVIVGSTLKGKQNANSDTCITGTSFKE